MATKKVSKIQKTADNLKNQAKQIHDNALLTSDNLVEASIATSTRWQKLMAKALKDGTSLFGNQQDMVLDTLETLKGQYLHGNKRLRKLIGVKAPSFRKAIEEVSKPTASKIKAVKDTSIMAKEIAKAGIKKAKKAVQGGTIKSKKINKAAPGEAKRTSPTKTTFKDNLTKIEGIGPKIEQILNKEGILTFKMLGTVEVATLRSILEDAGPRFKMHNPSTWRKQAKLAAKGNLDKLKDLQKKLKSPTKRTK